ncbi:PP2C family protein-serine/threonine phosphatase [Acetobacter sp.]|jgi:serine/threonine protein phosphatase PrpC|uniref:PP2C family protein-serine/threonine phosphatase n=1 Tax=Acetobacter sp. TaxID=440 RepID=UPI0025BE15B3|nr:protein phosphatase 2C domain-containing protein [Acetobacter sp.]MCH4092651.1 protein phosphatase 2C domain-containing protein [Acetobacter sp.]MCI1299785.1 protein phosphatase 2C domain-containing protein [Acetobacter sp.]MCI1315335.1 protein phosphatase 2C domain-containing protein [Acetobacter sp.]
MTETLKYSASTHQGTVRGENQDAFLCRPALRIFAVADGAGGHDDGRWAACRVIESLGALPQGLTPQALLVHARHRLTMAHEQLRLEAARRGSRKGMASTVVVLILTEEYFACLWVGDSRIYLLRDGELSQVTKDHSHAQALVDAGLMRTEDMEFHPQANVVTRAIGAGDTPIQIDKVTGPLLPFDRFLLCSDGLTKAVSERDILSCLETGTSSAELLVQTALLRHARDNVTAIVVSVEDEEAW